MEFLEPFLTKKLIATVVLVILLWGCRYFIARYIRRSQRRWSSQKRLKWISSTRSFVFVLMLLSVILLWGEAIQGFAVSIFAIVFAMVFSVKETLMCLNGSIVRLRGKFFDIGDRIEIEGIRGDVIDSTFLSTTVEEVGKGPNNHLYTGRQISFPNSLFLSHSVINESFLGNESVLRMEIPLEKEEDWKRGQETLLKIAEERGAPYLERSRRRMVAIAKNRGIELPSADPQVTLSHPEPTRIILHLQMVIPSRFSQQLEQAILTQFLESFHSEGPLEQLMDQVGGTSEEEE